MKKIIIIILLLMFGIIACVEKTVTAEPTVTAEEIVDETVGIYHSQEPTIYYIYELSTEDDCVIATRTKIIIGGNEKWHLQNWVLN